MTTQPTVIDTENWDEDATSAAHTTVTLPPVGPTKRPNGDTYYPRTIGMYEDLAWMRYLRAHRQHVLFAGPPGTGKSALSEAAFPDGFESLFCTADTTEADIVGGYIQDPDQPTQFTWANGPLLRSLGRGVPLIIEEIALADPRVLSVIYPAMDGRSYIEVPSNPALGKIPVPDGWCVVASYNPDVPGANISEALLDRFDHNVLVGTDWELAAYLGVDADILRVAQDLDRRRLDGEIAWSPQLRSLLAYKNAKDTFGADYALAALIAKAPATSRTVVASTIDKVFPRKGMTKNGTTLTPLTLCLGKRFR